MHDLPIVGHCEEKNMRATLSKIFYWPKMKEDVEHYVHTCVKCQKSSRYTKKSLGCTGIPIHSRLFENINNEKRGLN